MGTLSIADYFQNVKQLTDTLAIVHQPLDDFEVISYLIGGLSSDYDSFVTSVITKVDPMTLEEFYGYLLTHEQHLEQLHSIITDALHPTANARTNNPNNNVSHGWGQR